MKKAQIWRALRNIATHLQGKSGDNPITEQEAETSLFTVDLYLHQAGLVVEERVKRGEPGVRHLSLRVQVPCHNMPEFVLGVLLPLSDHGADVDVQVSFTARSQQGVENTTLRKLKETLDQISARILERRTEMTPRRLTRLQGSHPGYGGQNSLCGPDLLLRSTHDLCDWPSP